MKGREQNLFHCPSMINFKEEEIKMGLFGFGKKQQSKKGIDYRMYFDSALDEERNSQIKGLVLKKFGDIGLSVNNVKTTSNGYYGSTAEFTGRPGDVISIECARTPMSEGSSSFVAINVKSNICDEESIKAAFREIKTVVLEKGYYFTEF